MKKLIFLLLVFAGFMACENESIQELPQETSVTEDMTARQSGKVDVCHKGNIISVSVNALSAHQGHGDAIDMDGDGYFDIENDCSDVDCDDNAYSEDNSCYPFTCGEDLDFSDLEFNSSFYCSNYEYNSGCGEYQRSNLYLQWYDSEGYYNYIDFGAYDFNNYTCSNLDDYYVYVNWYKGQTNESCYETWGCTYCGVNMGEGTLELYDETVEFINNLAAELGIADSCADGARSSSADSVRNMQSMPDELKKIIEERKGLLPPNT